MDIKKLLKNIKLHETTVSMILGAVVIIVTGILIINYFDGKKGQTISTIETEEKTTLPTTHIITEGEDLWKISEKYYGSGYNWVDIVIENNISEPDKVKSGNELTIPDVEPRIAGVVVTTPKTILPTVLPTSQEQEVVLEKPENIHTVSKGETLWGIAEKYYGSGYNWVDIARENNLISSDQIETGQELIVPKIQAKTAIVADSVYTTAISETTYTVVKGDSLWDIAVRSFGDGYKWVDIAKENNLTNPNVIHPGNILSIPR